MRKKITMFVVKALLVLVPVACYWVTDSLAVALFVAVIVIAALEAL